MFSIELTGIFFNDYSLINALVQKQYYKVTINANTDDLHSISP